MNKISRREILGTAALGVLGYAPIAMSNEHEVSIEPAELMQDMHRDQVIHTVLGLREAGDGVLNRDGIQLSLDSLWRDMENDRNAFTEEDHRSLSVLIEEILGSQHEGGLHGTASGFADESLDNLGEVAKTIGALIVGSARDAIGDARQFLGDADWATILHVVAHDMRGAVDGARLGYQAHRRFGIPLPHAITVGALGGGISASVIGYGSAL